MLMSRFSPTQLIAGVILAFAGMQQAWADVVVIVSAKSTATTMTADEISQIFLGKSTAMKPVNNASTVRSQFYKLVTGRDEAQVKATWAKLVFTGKALPPKEMTSTADVVKAVAADPNAIGYVERSAVDPSVKVIYEVK
jgi:ABC-type phosphate transport system substrate-binding protein